MREPLIIPALAVCFMCPQFGKIGTIDMGKIYAAAQKSR